MDVALARRMVEAAAQAGIDDAARELELALQQEPRNAAVRRVLCPDLDLAWDTLRVRSLWLLTHRGLRRAGFRSHDESTAVFAAWRGEGLVLLRPPGERRSHALVAWNAPPSTAGSRAVVVPAGTPYDTLADAHIWHVLAAHSQPAAGLLRRALVRRDDEEIWIETPEEDPS